MTEQLQQLSTQIQEQIKKVEEIRKQQDVYFEIINNIMSQLVKCQQNIIDLQDKLLNRAINKQ